MRRLIFGVVLADGVALRWRWRRFVVRRRRPLVALSLLVSVLGVYLAPLLYVEWTRSVLSGRPLLYGQIVVRPVVTPGAVVRDPVVRLEPLVPGSLSPSGLLARLSPLRPLSVPVDFAGRWRVPFAFPPRLVPGVPYRVVVAAEGCAPRVAGVVRPGVVSSVRVDLRLASCMRSEWP